MQVRTGCYRRPCYIYFPRWSLSRHCESPRHFMTISGTPVHVKWYSYHAGTNRMLLNTRVNANMQLTINTFYPDTSLTYSGIPDIFRTAVKITDISRFFRQVVTSFLQGPADIDQVLFIECVLHCY